MLGHGRPEENLDVVGGEKLCGVACCVGSVVVLKYSATFDAGNEMAKEKHFYV